MMTRLVDKYLYILVINILFSEKREKEKSECKKMKVIYYDYYYVYIILINCLFEQDEKMKEMT